MSESLEATRTCEVVCAGILVADHINTPMDRLPEEGQLVAVDRMDLASGGCAANVGIDLAKQGIEVAVVGKVGDDYWGRFVREDLTRYGADASLVGVSAAEQTSQTMILLCKGQDRRFVHTFGANRDFSAADVPLSALEGASVFYLGGYLVMPRFTPEDAAALLRQCREHGIATVLDVVIPAGFRYAGELEAVLPHTDVFKPNTDEALLLTGESDPLRQIAALREKGARTIILSLGGDGLYFTEGADIYRASHFSTEMIDGTGAGDAFCAGFITGMVRGLDLEECVHYGSALGASCVRAMGACAGVLGADEAALFLADHRLHIERVT